MANMNKDTHDKIYPLIVQRDGEICKMCGKLANETKEGILLIDHKDNNNSNNTLNNLQFLCRSCNYWKNPEEELSEWDERVASPEMKKNEVMEKEFRRWIFGVVTEQGKLLLEEAVYAGAEIIEGSPESTKRYIKKMKSSAGIYEIVQLKDSKKYIRFKKEYRTPI